MVYFQSNYYNYYYLWLEINHFEVERGNKKNIERKLSITGICKGLAKLGNIVADANVSQFSHAGNMCCGNKFCCSETKNVFAMESKTFLLPGHKFCVRNICLQAKTLSVFRAAKFVSATHVSRAAKLGNICIRKNVF